jgi:CheY-like chemotaxis protein
LLAYSRHQELEPKLIHLNTVILDMVKMLHHMIGEDIELVTDLDANLHHVKLDPSQIEQVVLNLAVNARDAMPRGGKLAIQTRNLVLSEAYQQTHPDVRPGTYVMLRVTDTGCGMDEATRSRLFEPFFTTKDLGKGTGLGLATVYGVVKQSGGHIEVASTPGRGTTFTLYFPKTSSATMIKPSHPGLRKTPMGKETILLVEDDGAVRELARTVLEERCGYIVLAASHGDDALRLAGTPGISIDLLVSDVVMPRMRGTDLAAKLCQRLPHLKVLFLSGYLADSPLQQTLQQIPGSYLGKPFTPESLARKVREILDE